MPGIPSRHLPAWTRTHSGVCLVDKYRRPPRPRAGDPSQDAHRPPKGSDPLLQTANFVPGTLWIWRYTHVRRRQIFFHIRDLLISSRTTFWSRDDLPVWNTSRRTTSWRGPSRRVPSPRGQSLGGTHPPTVSACARRPRHPEGSHPLDHLYL